MLVHAHTNFWSKPVQPRETTRYAPTLPPEASQPGFSTSNVLQGT